ncbi:hypothetical protein MHYP_G00129230 [Metynnis hypsauchen]
MAILSQNGVGVWGEESDSSRGRGEASRDFAKLYELDSDPNRKEFLDDLFTFMQKRVELMNVPLVSLMAEARVGDSFLRSEEGNGVMCVWGREKKKRLTGWRGSRSGYPISVATGLSQQGPHRKSFTAMQSLFALLPPITP